MGIWFVTFWLQSKRALLRGLLTRRALLLAAGMILLLAIQVIILYFRFNPTFLNGFFVGFHCWATLSIIVPIAAMYLGVTCLLEDTERGSIAYLFSRPAPRSAILLGRFAGAGITALLFALAVVGLSALVADRMSPGELLPQQAPLFCRAGGATALCFTALGVCLGSFTTKGLLWGIGLVTGGELVMGGMLAKAQMTGFRSVLVTDMARQSVLADLWPGLDGESRLWLARHMTSLPAGQDSTGLLLAMGRYGLVVLLLGLLFFCLKEQRYKSGGN